MLYVNRSKVIILSDAYREVEDYEVVNADNSTNFFNNESTRSCMMVMRVFSLLGLVPIRWVSGRNTGFASEWPCR